MRLIVKKLAGYPPLIPPHEVVQLSGIGWVAIGTGFMHQRSSSLMSATQCKKPLLQQMTATRHLPSSRGCVSKTKVRLRNLGTFIGIMENKMETTIVCWGCMRIMENEMETTIVYWGSIGIMEIKMESGNVAYRTQGFRRSTFMFGCRGDAACVVTLEAMCPKQLIRTTITYNQVHSPKLTRKPIQPLFSGTVVFLGPFWGSRSRSVIFPSSAKT